MESKSQGIYPHVLPSSNVKIMAHGSWLWGPYSRDPRGSPTRIFILVPRGVNRAGSNAMRHAPCYGPCHACVPLPITKMYFRALSKIPDQQKRNHLWFFNGISQTYPRGVAGSQPIGLDTCIYISPRKPIIVLEYYMLIYDEKGIVLPFTSIYSYRRFLIILTCLFCSHQAFLQRRQTPAMRLHATCAVPLPPCFPVAMSEVTGAECTDPHTSMVTSVDEDWAALPYCTLVFPFFLFVLLSRFFILVAVKPQSRTRPAAHLADQMCETPWNRIFKIVTGKLLPTSTYLRDSDTSQGLVRSSPLPCLRPWDIW
ncbi:hypothetical protein F4818DRAFT_35257 [Hypoxylon cercidicola]|nr:hypothetical protein F4818DRAFT_35257 [Hypoxylon cercidicola]